MVGAQGSMKTSLACLTPYGVRGFDIDKASGSFMAILLCLTPYGVRGFDILPPDVLGKKLARVCLTPYSVRGFDIALARLAFRNSSCA